jgi:DNA (cytosine-5)-methyltransferase 1
MRPRVLDLFCGGGGSAMGYYRAGYEVVGVDINPQPNYPFLFKQGNWWDIWPEPFDVIHASPPCQRYSDLAHRNGNADDHPDWIAQVRTYVNAYRKPYIIENVEGAPLQDPIRLCGTMFPGLRVIRHRLFETNFPIHPPEHGRHPLVFTYDKRKAHYGKLDQDTSYVQVTGGGNCTVANKRAAMGINWMNGAELNEAIPPAYTEFIGRQLMKVL